MVWYFVANRRSQVASAILDVGETTSFEVCYQAVLAGKSQGQIRLSVVDNQYEDCVVHLVAEAYEDDISIDNVASVAELSDDVDEVTMVDGDVPGTWLSSFVVTSQKKTVEIGHNPFAKPVSDSILKPVSALWYK